MWGSASGAKSVSSMAGALSSKLCDDLRDDLRDFRFRDDETSGGGCSCSSCSASITEKFSSSELWDDLRVSCLLYCWDDSMFDPSELRLESRLFDSRFDLDFRDWRIESRRLDAPKALFASTVLSGSGFFNISMVIFFLL
jgi:hypothetical protein